MHQTPTTLTEVTSEWLSDALGRQVDDLTVQPIAAGEGFMGQLARVRIISPLVSSGDLPATMIVKLPTGDPGGQVMGQMMRVWEREHCFYRDVAPHMNVRVPSVYVNIADPPCLVLEDLAPARPGDHVAGATIEQADQSIDVLARHHAHWFQHPMLAELNWMPALDDPSVETIGPVFEMGWPVFLQRYESQLPARCLRWCERFVTDLPTWIGGHFDDPITITHGDFRLDNLFFLGNGDVAIIDWQLSMRAPGQADLVYFCANNLTTPMRRVHEQRLIQRYVDGVHAAGVPTDSVTLDGVRRGYLEGLVFYAATFGAGLLSIDPANDRGVALFDALVMRTFAAVEDLDAGAAIGIDG